MSDPLPTSFNPCVSGLANRWVGYYDNTSSGTYQAAGEAWVNAYDLTTVPWDNGVVGNYNNPGETIPDNILTGVTGAGGDSYNFGGYPNSSAERMDLLGGGQYWIVGIWHDPANPTAVYQKACVGTFPVGGCGGCGTSSVLSLPIPPDDLVQTDYTVDYDFTQNPTDVSSITAYCATPGNCGVGLSFTVPCDAGDPFFGTPP